MKPARRIANLGASFGASLTTGLAIVLGLAACAGGSEPRSAGAARQEPVIVITRAEAFSAPQSAAPTALPIATLEIPVRPSAPLHPATTLDDGERLARRAEFAEAMLQVEERQKVFDGKPAHIHLDGHFAQGGLVFGQTEPAAKVRLDGEDVMVGADGRFVIGFERDSVLSALLIAILPDGTIERRAVEIEDREFPVQRIDGLDQSKVSDFTEEQLAKIAVDSEKKKAARQTTQNAADWAAGFDWPIEGRISGVFGSQRILNGEPKNPHSGVDVAAPAGAIIRAPAPGVVRLAETDMYFEGGLVLIDHGHWLESAIMHMSRVDVRPGQRVEKGDVIGAVGATGRATGPHMHWSVKWTGLLVDPQLLAGEMAPAAGAGSE